MVITFEIPSRPRPGPPTRVDIDALRREVANVRSNVFDPLTSNGLGIGKRYEIFPAVAGIIDSVRCSTCSRDIR